MSNVSKIWRKLLGTYESDDDDTQPDSSDPVEVSQLAQRLTALEFRVGAIERDVCHDPGD